MISEICAFDKFTLTDKLFHSKIFETCIMASNMFVEILLPRFQAHLLKTSKLHQIYFLLLILIHFLQVTD